MKPTAMAFSIRTGTADETDETGAGAGAAAGDAGDCGATAVVARAGEAAGEGTPAERAGEEVLDVFEALEW